MEEIEDARLKAELDDISRRIDDIMDKVDSQDPANRLVPEDTGCSNP